MGIPMKPTDIRTRSFWLNLVEQKWQRSILWLAGVRRVGKTVLCNSIKDVEYFDCELPRIRRLMDDPEGFLEGVKGRTVVLDEIHRLENPSQLLKIAADHYPATRIIATGSSALGASSRFKDTLAGRKTDLLMTPMVAEDLADFDCGDLKRRFLRGGLPPFFLEGRLPESWFQEWVDAFWAKDVQELFRLERRHSFQKFLELLMAQSGGIFEASRLARPCEVSRTTITNYLSVLEATFIAAVIRPFSTNRPAEIVSAPKVYGFDTGFVCYFKGWHDLRSDDMGVLWEHYVLNELQAQLQTRRINYWRDKRGHEVDFVLAERGRHPIAIECKWSAAGFDPSGLQAFRRQYEKGENYVVVNDVGKTVRRSLGKIAVTLTTIPGLIKALRADAR
jgi:predicted AAA+ superfamily ATPase